MQNVDINKKFLLNMNEATEYFGIGTKTLTKFLNEHNEFSLHVGAKRLVKRTALEQYLSKESELHT